MSKKRIDALGPAPDPPINPPAADGGRTAEPASSDSAPSAPAVAPGPRVRNLGIRKVRVADLEDAPWNWRRHDKRQKDALGAAIDEIGWVGYPDVYETPEGKLRLTDGHCRKQVLIEQYGPDAVIDVNVTDFDEADAKKANLTKDPLAAMAEQEDQKLAALIGQVETNKAELHVLFEEMYAGCEDADEASGGSGAAKGDPLPAMELQPYEHYDYVIVLATNVHEWHALIEKLGLERVDSSITETTTMKKVGLGRAVRAGKLLEMLNR